MTNTKTQKEIAWQKKLDNLMDRLGFIPVNENHVAKCKSDRKKIKALFSKTLTQKLEHLAKQKDEEFMEMIGEDEDTTGGEGHGNMFRNALRSELRNKLQGGGK